MPKPKKTPDIIEAIRHKSLFGSSPAFQSLETLARVDSVVEGSLRVADGR